MSKGFERIEPLHGNNKVTIFYCPKCDRKFINLNDISSTLAKCLVCKIRCSPANLIIQLHDDEEVSR